jgi:hypothetical protein
MDLREAFPIPPFSSRQISSRTSSRDSRAPFNSISSSTLGPSVRDGRAIISGMARVRIKVTEGPSTGALLTFSEPDNVLEVRDLPHNGIQIVDRPGSKLGKLLGHYRFEGERTVWEPA